MIVCRKKRKKFNILRSVQDLEKEIDRMPAADECFKFISLGNFSAISFILFIAKHVIINDLFVSTFRVGKKETLALNGLVDQGKLKNLTFVFFNLMEEGDDEKYKYLSTLRQAATKNSWTLNIKQNHSKVMLFDTDGGKFVIETSANLNENPKIEQFSFEQDADLFDFYKQTLFE